MQKVDLGISSTEARSSHLRAFFISALMKKSDRDLLALEISHIFDSGANELRVVEAVERFIKTRYSYDSQANELSRLKDGGHVTLDSAISMLQKKSEFYREGKHWFIFEGNRNVCEFCGELYHISERDGYCDLKKTKKRLAV